jgi:outer membrane immunogenic protein
MKKALLPATAVALAFFAGSALAADLPSQKGPPPAYLPPPPLMTWNGFYAGVNVGYGFSGSNGSVNGFETGPVGFTGEAWSYPQPNLNGVIGGGQIGYNWQFANSFVAGIEADIQGADLSGASSGVSTLDSTGSYLAGLATRQRLDWFGTVRGRLGYLFTPTLLVYGTAGFAYGQGSSHFAYADTTGSVAAGFESDTRTGWTAGGGLEWMFAPNWSAKVEYLYTDLGRGQGFAAPEFAAGALNGFAVTQSPVQNRFHTVRAGLNYHFNWGAAPVVAKY